MYHVINRGNARAPIFLDARDEQRFIADLERTVVRHRWWLYAFVLMPNHFHLVVETPSADLSRGMHRLTTSYSAFFNARHHRVGHVFQGRFKALLCDSEVYLMTLVRYVHLNPVAASLVSRAGDYSWSSHKAYLGQVNWPWVAENRLLAKLAPDLEVARQTYLTFLEEGLGWRGEDKRLENGIAGKYLGDEIFIERMKRLEREEVRGKARPAIKSVPLGKLLAMVCRDFHVSVAEVRSSRRGRLAALVRSVFCHLGERYAHHPGRVLAAYLGRSPAMVSRWVRDTETRVQMDQAFAVTMEKLGQEISGISAKVNS